MKTVQIRTGIVLYMGRTEADDRYCEFVNGVAVDCPDQAQAKLDFEAPHPGAEIKDVATKRRIIESYGLKLPSNR